VVTNRGGGTAFGPPLLESLIQIEQYDHLHDSNFIILYTDGGAEYPSPEVQILIEKEKALRNKINLLMICEDSNPPAHKQIAQNLEPHISSVAVRTNTTPHALMREFPEVLSHLLYT